MKVIFQNHKYYYSNSQIIVKFSNTSQFQSLEPGLKSEIILYKRVFHD